jgi:predicted kinase
MAESTLYIMCGLPFSGKTTLAQSLATQCDLVHLDVDAFARERSLLPEEGINDEQWGHIFRQVYEQVATLLASGQSVVVDAVNFDKAGRNRFRMLAQRSGSSVYVIYVNLPIAEIERRRQANQAKAERPPVRDEDFVELVTQFEIPTMEENLLIYNGVQSISEWIQNNIGCDSHA